MTVPYSFLSCLFASFLTEPTAFAFAFDTRAGSLFLLMVTLRRMEEGQLFGISSRHIYFFLSSIS